MVLRKIFMFGGFLGIVVANSGYADLSKTMVESMTGIWNEKQANARVKLEAKPGLLDYFYDDSNSDASKDDSSSREEITPHHVKPDQQADSLTRMPYTMSSTPQRNYNKSQQLRYGSMDNPYLRQNRPMPQPTPSKSIRKAVKKKPGPLHRALHNLRPLSLDELLQYYDYLDDSEEVSSSQSKHNCTGMIESMLGKFLKTVTSLVERPIVVHTNVCCGNTPGEQQHSDGKNTIVATASGATKEKPIVPSYIGHISSMERYAPNHDLVAELKEKYDKLVHLLNSTNTESQTGLVASIGNTNVPVPVQPSIQPVVGKTVAPVIDSQAAPTGNLPQPDDSKKDITVPMLPGVLTTTEMMVESTTVNPPEEQGTSDVAITTTESPLPDESTPSNAENAVAAPNETPTDPPPALETRKRRQALFGNKIQQAVSLPDEESSTQKSSDMSFDDFVRDALGNNTGYLDTLVLNQVPIVEHIHANLLEREKATVGEWVGGRGAYERVITDRKGSTISKTGT